MTISLQKHTCQRRRETPSVYASPLASGMSFWREVDFFLLEVFPTTWLTCCRIGSLHLSRIISALLPLQTPPYSKPRYATVITASPAAGFSKINIHGCFCILFVFAERHFIANSGFKTRPQYFFYEGLFY